MATKAEREIKLLEIKQALEDKANNVERYWGGTTSDLTRAQDRKEWAEKMKQIDANRAQKEQQNLVARGQDTEIAKAGLTTQSAQAVADARHASAIEAALIKAGGGTDGSGSGTGSRRGKGDPIGAAATDIYTKQTIAPGQKGMTPQDARKAAETLYAQNAAPSLEGLDGAAPADIPGMIPGTPVGAVRTRENTIPVPGAQAPDLPAFNPLSEARFKQYGDKKGYSYQGLQPGMQNDQIAKFTGPDGVARFANAGAVSNALVGVDRPNANAQQMRSGPGGPSLASQIPNATKAAHTSAQSLGQGKPKTSLGIFDMLPQDPFGMPAADIADTAVTPMTPEESGATTIMGAAHRVTPGVEVPAPAAPLPLLSSRASLNPPSTPASIPVLDSLGGKDKPGLLEWLNGKRDRKASLGYGAFSRLKDINSASFGR